MEEAQIVEFKQEMQTALAAAESLKVSKFEDVMDAADFLLDVKTVGERITSRKEEITKPMNDSLKSARALFKPLEEMYGNAESVVKDKILAWHQKNWGKDKDTDNTIHGIRGKVTVAERFVVEITDEASVPREFCAPDTKKVEHALKAGIAVKGARLVPSYTIMAGKN